MRSGLLVALAASAGLTVAACGGSVPGAARTSTAPGAARTSVAPTPTASGPGASGRTKVTLVVPRGLGGGAFARRRQVVVPKGWTARVWARVPGARMEAW